jgi:hypothetical protein
MAGLDPAIHAFFVLYMQSEDVDARHKAHKAGHDERYIFPAAATVGRSDDYEKANS